MWKNIGLEENKIKVDRGHVLTDEWGHTDVKGVHAIGDLTGPPWLAHKASHEGVILVEKNRTRQREQGNQRSSSDG